MRALNVRLSVDGFIRVSLAICLVFVTTIYKRSGLILRCRCHRHHRVTFLPAQNDDHDDTLRSNEAIAAGIHMVNNAVLFGSKAHSGLCDLFSIATAFQLNSGFELLFFPSRIGIKFNSNQKCTENPVFRECN